MAKANQKFTNTKPPRGKVTNKGIGKGNYRHPDDIGLIKGSPQYEEQTRRHEHQEHK